MQRRCLTILLLVLVCLSVAWAPQPQRSVTYQRYDVSIDVRADGSLLVAETYELRFEGEFRTGFAEIPTRYVSDIVDVTVREGEEDYRPGSSGPKTYSVARDWDVIRVNWEYEPTSGTEVRTFTVQYRVLGGLRVYPDGDELLWTAVPSDRSGIPVEGSRVTVRLPEPVDREQLEAGAPGADVDIVDDQTIVFEARGSIPDGTSLEVRVGFPHNLTAATVTEWQRQLDEALASYHWGSLDVDLVIGPKGSLDVTETHTLVVDEGYLYRSDRTIPWLYLDAIADVEVSSKGEPFRPSQEPCEQCFVVEQRPGSTDWAAFNGRQVVINEDRVGSTLVEWAFPALEAGNAATFRLSYTVLGAVRVLTDAQEIDWTVVFADRDAPVDTAQARLHLPAKVSAEEVTVSGGVATLQTDGALLLTHDERLPPGDAWSVKVQMPVDATTAQKPAWQAHLEEQLESEESYVAAERQRAAGRARWQVGLGALGCLFPVLGLVGVVGAWYVWGRDKAGPMVASYLTDPPSDLPPGIVAYLVDEKPTVKGVLADLLHLATLGLISVDLQKRDFTIQLNWTDQIDAGESVTVGDGEPVELVDHERTLFNLLVARIRGVSARAPQAGKHHRLPVPFSQVQKAFLAGLPTVYEEMGEAASQYFAVLPETARRRWRFAGQIVVLAAAVLGVVGLCGTLSVGWPACAPPLGLATVGLMLVGVSRWMPRRTTLGIEEAARWRAFRRYLKNLRQFGDVEAAQAVLDLYFPYAVALDVDEIVLEQAERMETLVPVWMVPAPVSVGRAPGGGRAPRRLGRRVTEAVRMPASTAASPRAAKARPRLSERPAGADLSLQGLSDRLSRSLNSASRSLSSVLNAAMGDVDEIDSPFEVVVRGAGKATRMSWKAGTTTMKVLGDILEESSSGGGGGGFSGGGFRSSSWSSGGSSFRGGSSSRSSGGGSRGFG